MSTTKRLNIKNTEAYDLAAALAAASGQTLTAVVIAALRNRLALVRKVHVHTEGVRQAPGSKPD
jgi:hypothetical protein